MDRSNARQIIRRRGTQGQALVEFALVFPLFLILLLSTIEFAFALNAVLSANYSTRDASLIGAEAGSNKGSDCQIIAQVLADMTPPVDASRITQIVIYQANASGGPVSGSYSGSGNVWTHNLVSTTDCSAYGGSSSLPFDLTTANYPEGLPNLTTGAGGRCDYINGCPSNALRTRDTIGVQVSYTYTWHTPLPNFVPLASGSFTITRANEMRMEPIL
jgi:Flp pilus assembly protein TadG